MHNITTAVRRLPFAPAPKDMKVTDVKKGDLPALAGAYARLIEAAQGGTLGLFTAIQRLKAVHARIADRLAQPEGRWRPFVPAGVPGRRGEVTLIEEDTGVTPTTAEGLARLSPPEEAAWYRDVLGAEVVGVDSGEVPEERCRELEAAGVAVHEARRSRTNLEELFARLTEEP